MNRYFFDLVYTEPCREGENMIPFQIQSRIYILANDEEDAMDRIGYFFNRPIGHFTLLGKKIDDDVQPEILEPGEAWHYGKERRTI